MTTLEAIKYLLGLNLLKVWRRKDSIDLNLENQDLTMYLAEYQRYTEIALQSLKAEFSLQFSCIPENVARSGQNIIA